MYIVGYVIGSSTRDERTWNMVRSVQAPDSTEVTSEFNQVLESQSTTDGNSQSTIQSAQYDNEDIAMDSPVKESKGPMNCPFLLKRKQALTRK